MYDSVRLLAKAMDDLATMEGFRVDRVRCAKNQRPWEDGEKIIKYIKKVGCRFA